ncbi:MAG TPA: hypothetical protein VN657_11655 [Nitrospiraceae bacterium]|nr:hypothetical protein [Nitrospiraceae bacterium]
MISFPKIVSRMSSWFVLYLSLSNLTYAAPDRCVDTKSGPSSIVCGEERRDGIVTIKGEVLGIEGHDYVVQQFYGKAVRLMTDGASQVTGTIGLGDSIEAKVHEVDNRKHVLSIHQIK